MKYTFRARIWRYKGKAAWYFVTLPKPIAKKIRLKYGTSEEGWGRLKTSAKIGQTSWSTAIWFDTKAGSYLLPLKTIIRKSEALKLDTMVNVTLQLDSSPSRMIKNSSLVKSLV